MTKQAEPKCFIFWYITINILRASYCMCIACVLSLLKFPQIRKYPRPTVTLDTTIAFSIYSNVFGESTTKGGKICYSRQGKRIEQFFSFVRILLDKRQRITRSLFPVRPRGSFAPVFHRSSTARTHDNWIVNPIKRNGLSRLRKRSRCKHAALWPLSKNIMMRSSMLCITVV